MKNQYDPIINRITLLYGIVPIVIFFLGWLRPLYAIPVSLVLVYSAFVYANRIDGKTAAVPLRVNWFKTILVAFVALIWVYCSGIGGYTNQQWDHNVRNAVFHDLLAFDWPVQYDFPANYHLEDLAGKHSSLNYYFTYWLPAAGVGKLLGDPAANAFLLAWTYGGILLSLYYLNRLFSFTYPLVSLGLFMLWSNFDLLTYLLTHRVLSSTAFFSGFPHFQFYTSFTGDLYNPFNQAVPAWVFTLYVLNTGKKLQIFPVVILLAYSPFAFVGLALAHGLYALTVSYQTNGKIQPVLTEIGQALWRPESLGTLTILVVYGLFYQAHTGTVQNTAFWKLHAAHDLRLDTFSVLSYLAAFFSEVGIYLLFVYTLAKQTYTTYKTWFWLIFGGLLVLPLWVVGAFSDLTTRASIPFLTVLFIITLRALIELHETRSRRTLFYTVLLVFLLSVHIPVTSLIQSVSFTGKPVFRDAIGSLANPRFDESNDPENLLSSLPNYYSHDPQHYFFYRYLARR